MMNGRLLQCDTPHEIYERPADQFVADFIGVMNFLDGKLTADGVELAYGPRIAGVPPPGAPLGSAATAAIRPERIRLFPEHVIANRLAGQVEAVVYHGLDLQLSIETGLSERPLLVRVTAEDADRRSVAVGDTVEIGWDAACTRIFVE